MIFHELYVRKESGSVLIITLLVLMAVTILGVTSLDKGIIELKIARNEKEARTLFYLSEAVCMEGIQRLIDTVDVDLDEQIQCWHHPRKSKTQETFDFRKPSRWDIDGIGTDNAQSSAMNADSYFAAVEWKVASGSSLLQTGTRLYQNRVYGLCQKYGAENVIEIGYDIRY